MPFEIVWEERGVLLNYLGSVTAAELESACVRINADRRYDDITYVIADYRALTSLISTEAEMSELAAIDYAAALTNPRLVQAHVVDNARYMPLICQYLESNDSGHRQCIFSRMQDARAWVNDDHQRQVCP